MQNIQSVVRNVNSADLSYGQHRSWIEPDRDEAEAHLALLGGAHQDRFTFQAFSDFGKEPGDNDPLARTLYGTLDQHWTALVSLSRKGAGVFVTVSECGPPRSGKTRKGKDVVRAFRTNDDFIGGRAVHGEFDYGMPDDLPLAPSFTVQSSVEGKVHAYWLSEKVLTFEQVIGMNQRIVQDHGADKNAVDRVRVLRLAGFPHQKDPTRPIISRLIDVNELSDGSVKVYSPEELSAAFPPVAISAAKARCGTVADPLPAWLVRGQKELAKMGVTGPVGSLAPNMKEYCTPCRWEARKARWQEHIALVAEAYASGVKLTRFDPNTRIGCLHVVWALNADVREGAPSKDAEELFIEFCKTGTNFGTVIVDSAGRTHDCTESANRDFFVREAAGDTGAAWNLGSLTNDIRSAGYDVRSGVVGEGFESEQGGSAVVSVAHDVARVGAQDFADRMAIVRQAINIFPADKSAITDPTVLDAAGWLSVFAKVEFDQVRREVKRARGGRIADWDTDVERYAPSRSTEGRLHLSQVQRELRERYTVIQGMGRKLVVHDGVTGHFMDPAAFAGWEASRRGANAAKDYIFSSHRVDASGLTFVPEKGRIVDGKLNTWKGWTLRRDAYDLVKAAHDACPTIRRHVREVLASGAKEHSDYMFRWLAWSVQNPTLSPQTAIFLRSGEGTGKSMFIDGVFTALFAPYSKTIAKGDQITGRFNAALKDTCALHAVEAFFAGDPRSWGALKSAVTDATIVIEPKGVDPYEIPNTIRLLGSTNQDFVVPASPDSRRWVVLDVSDKFKRITKEGGMLSADEIEHNAACHDYFSSLDVAVGKLAEGRLGTELEAFASWLSLLDLRGWVPWVNTPKTAALLDQKLASLRGVDRWMYDALCEGRLPTASSWDAGPVTVSGPAREGVVAEINQGMRNPMSRETIGRGLAKYGVVSRRSNGGNRERMWVFPVLDTVRATFSNMIGHEIDWRD